MMAHRVKLMTHARSDDLHKLFGSLGKSAVLDLLGDVLDCNYGEEWTLETVMDMARPRLRIRKDREPKAWGRIDAE